MRALQNLKKIVEMKICYIFVYAVRICQIKFKKKMKICSHKHENCLCFMSTNMYRIAGHNIMSLLRTREKCMEIVFRVIIYFVTQTFSLVRQIREPLWKLNYSVDRRRHLCAYCIYIRKWIHLTKSSFSKRFVILYNVVRLYSQNMKYIRIYI